MKKNNYMKIVEGTCKLKSHRYYTDIIGSYAKKHIVILKINEIIGLTSYQLSLGNKKTHLTTIYHIGWGIYLSYVKYILIYNLKKYWANVSL